MIGKRITKIIQNIEKRKFRDKYKLFKIEGDKIVNELLNSSFKPVYIIGIPEWNPDFVLSGTEVIRVNKEEMQKLSAFASPPEVIAIVEIPETGIPEVSYADKLILILNGIQDPGNFGTIVRTADWFGIRDIYCDTDCCDRYNPKALQASMGSVFRVNIRYTDIENLICSAPPGFPCFGTVLDGKNIYEYEKLPSAGFIVMGNEGRGINPELRSLITERIRIPDFPHSSGSVESLNVSVATGIVLSEFRRHLHKP